MPTPPTARLNSGHPIPLVGLGLWKVHPSTCASQVALALRTGYRLLDGACDYGNEVQAGQGVASAIADGVLTRSELFVTTKLWATFHAPGRVEAACRRQLADWGLEYFDLFLVHFPVSLEYVEPGEKYPPEFTNPRTGKVEGGGVPLVETWRAMEGLVEKGLVRSIGVSNYNGGLMTDLWQYAKVKPAVLQVEHHPYLTQAELLTWCAERGVQVTAYSSFGPQSFLELEMKKAMDAELLMENEVVRRAAEKHGKSAAQVLLRWATQRGVAVIPKSNNPDRLAQNLDVLGWDLSEGEVREISGLDRGLRFNNPMDYGVPFPIFG